MLENYPLTVGKLQRLLTLGDLKHAIRLETILHSQLSKHEAGSQTPRFSKLKPSLISIQALTRPGAQRPRSIHSRKPYNAGARWGI